MWLVWLRCCSAGGGWSLLVDVQMFNITEPIKIYRLEKKFCSWKMWSTCTYIFFSLHDMSIYVVVVMLFFQNVTFLIHSTPGFWLRSCMFGEFCTLLNIQSPNIQTHSLTWQTTERHALTFICLCLSLGCVWCGCVRRAERGSTCATTLYTQCGRMWSRGAK